MSNPSNPITHESFEKLISSYVKKGYKVVSRTPTTAQLVREKKFSCLIATVTFLFLAIPFFVYLFWYLANKEKTVYIEFIVNTDPEKRRIIVTKKNGRTKHYKKDPTKSAPLPKWVNIILIVFLMLFTLLVVIAIITP
jgi:Mn2+/Fe2+ NRAMP family transporter